MHMRVVSFSSAAVLLCAFASAGEAQITGDRPVNTSVDRAFEPSPRDCADVRWSQRVLNEFPSVASGCQAVEQRNGRSYVKLEGQVEDVRDGGKRIRVDLKDGNEITFTPTPRTGLYIDGERTEFGELEAGARLNFYIPEDRLQAELQPDPKRMSYIIVPLDIDVATIRGQSQTAGTQAADGRQQRDSMRAAADSDRLPDTAGPLPLVALGGVTLLALGAGLTIRRKRRNRWNAWF